MSKCFVSGGKGSSKISNAIPIEVLVPYMEGEPDIPLNSFLFPDASVTLTSISPFADYSGVFTLSNNRLLCIKVTSAFVYSVSSGTPVLLSTKTLALNGSGYIELIGFEDTFVNSYQQSIYTLHVNASNIITETLVSGVSLVTQGSNNFLATTYDGKLLIIAPQATYSSTFNWYVFNITSLSTATLLTSGSHSLNPWDSAYNGGIKWNINSVTSGGTTVDVISILACSSSNGYIMFARFLWNGTTLTRIGSERSRTLFGYDTGGSTWAISFNLALGPCLFFESSQSPGGRASARSIVFSITGSYTYTNETMPIEFQTPNTKYYNGKKINGRFVDKVYISCYKSAATMTIFSLSGNSFVVETAYTINTFFSERQLQERAKLAVTDGLFFVFPVNYSNTNEVFFVTMNQKINSSTSYYCTLMAFNGKRFAFPTISENIMGVVSKKLGRGRYELQSLETYSNTIT